MHAGITHRIHTNTLLVAFYIAGEKIGRGVSIPLAVIQTMLQNHLAFLIQALSFETSTVFITLPNSILNLMKPAYKLKNQANSLPTICVNLDGLSSNSDNPEAVKSTWEKLNPLNA